MSSRPIVEVLPESMAFERKCPGASQPTYPVLEHAFGVTEKTNECIKLPPIFTLKEKAVVRTYNWLAPAVYSIDPQSGAIIVRDILAPAPYAEYVLESIGGERIKKHVDVGIVYVPTRTIKVNINEEVACYTQERIPVKVRLEWIKLRVADLPRFLVELWKRHGDLAARHLADELKTSFARGIEERVASLDLDTVLVKKSELRRTLLETAKPVLEGYGIEVLDVEVTAAIDHEYFEYYFWHKVHELPVEYAYVLHVIRKVPESVLARALEPVLATILAVLSRKHPEIVKCFEALLSLRAEREGHAEPAA